MSEKNLNEQPLEPLFDFETAPKEVNLFHGEIILSYKNYSYTTEVDVVLKFTPTPSVIMKVVLSIPSVPGELINLLINFSNEITYKINGIKVEGLIKSFNVFSGDLYILPSKQPVQVVGNTEVKNTVASVFHLFNFPVFSGKNAHLIHAPVGYRHLILQNNQWQAIIQSLPSTKQAADQIKTEGGVFLTHVGKLERIDGKRFSGAETDEQYDLIYSFLSFATGVKCRPVCRVGLDENGTRTWEYWSSPVSSHVTISWFNPLFCHQVELLFPLFSQRWKQSKEWEGALRSSIYWYLQANTLGEVRGIDAAIILAQSALERLAYHYLVIDQEKITEKQFINKNFKTSDKLRQLLSSLKIPIDITGDMPSIKKEQACFKWEDIPHALTDIRNSLIHPVSKDKERMARCYVDAWRFSLWYIELTILALCGYEDSYRNRLKNTWTADVDDVPWKNKEA